jgi:hypothetical protein
MTEGFHITRKRIPGSVSVTDEMVALFHVPVQALLTALRSLYVPVITVQFQVRAGTFHFMLFYRTASILH